MQITINLSDNDIRIAESIVRNQTHFILNSHTLEDAVITGILTQISKKNIPNIKGGTDQHGFPLSKIEVIHDNTTPSQSLPLTPLKVKPE